MKSLSIAVVTHDRLTRADLGGLRRLFDSEYREEFGDWDPEQPYGYASHDVHVIARTGDRIVGHAGWARRTITVGAEVVVIAGVGGVLISDDARGQRLGADILQAAERSMRDHGGIDFGYLGCREGIVSFYAACGWTRIRAGERSIGRTGEPVADPPGQPILILPISAPGQSWPEGEIDLRGRAW